MPDPLPAALPPVQIANSQLRSLHSTVIGQNYQIKVWLPDAYDAAKAYPVLYLLDGDHAFALATDVVQYLIYGQHVPDLIVVSPAYGSKASPDEGGANRRTRDLSPFQLSWTEEPPGGAQYFRFFQQELIPHVESLYHIDPANRTLYGGSLGLLFVLYSLFQSPALFRNYIAVDGFHPQLLELEAAYAAQHAALPAKVCLLSGRAYEERMAAFYETLKSRSYEGLMLQYADMDMDHFLLPAPSLAQGLTMVFG